MSWGNDTRSQDEEMKTAAEYGQRAEPLPDIHIHSVLTAGDAEYGDALRDRRARQEHLEREITSLAKRLAAPLSDEKPRRRLFRRAAAKSE
jgi:transcription elongation GreA/GreB family factor